MFRKIGALALAALLAAAVGCGGKKPKDPYADIDRSCVFGMDEPVLEVKDWQVTNGRFNHTVEGFDMDITADLLQALGVKSFRFRIPQGFMANPDQYNREAYDYLKSAIKKLRDAGVTLLVGLIDYFPAYTAFSPDSARSVPHLDDPAYGEWMRALEDMTRETCKLFPEITWWEMGNEMNSANFFHPNGYNKQQGSIEDQAGGFEHEEQVKIYTDYMYYAAAGIHAANPENKAVTSGLAATEKSFKAIEYFLDDCYGRIASGEAPTCSDEKSADARDYFDALCWHPYYTRIDETWVKYNDDVYQVAIERGDEGIPVFFTEFGFTDAGYQDQQDLHIQYTEKAFEYVLADMPYVMSVCSFRMYQCSHAIGWGGNRQNYFGFFSEPVGENKGFVPRKKALELQKIYGGTGDLYKYADLTAVDL